MRPTLIRPKVQPRELESLKNLSGGRDRDDGERERERETLRNRHARVWRARYYVTKVTARGPEIEPFALAASLWRKAFLNEKIVPASAASAYTRSPYCNCCHL